MRYLVNGYWKDDKSEIKDYIMSSDTEDFGDDVFYSGVTKEQLEDGDFGDFQITSYEEI